MPSVTEILNTESTEFSVTFVLEAPRHRDHRDVASHKGSDILSPQYKELFGRCTSAIAFYRPMLTDAKSDRRNQRRQECGAARKFTDNHVFVEGVRAFAHAAQAVERRDTERGGEIPI